MTTQTEEFKRCICCTLRDEVMKKLTETNEHFTLNSGDSELLCPEHTGEFKHLKSKGRFETRSDYIASYANSETY
ncbi:hypothetical protein [Streptomyces sp. CoH17]|uniref:hypothetical protein n=1 Tax=Streptomyces sp. CoH17 TaxID=2992806 RepID=UPI00227162B4|nr:hypothetical protein [Streptomyces sp. CoH17]